MKFFIFLVFLPLGIMSAQNVGIGEPNPQEKLHINGGLRVDSLAGVQDRLVYADSNGTVQTLPHGSQGEILFSQGSSGPPIWGALFPSATTVYGTGALNASNTTAWTTVPGLVQTIVVDSTDKLLVIAEGGVQNQSNLASVATYTDIGIFVDNVLVGSSRRIPALNTATSIYATGSFSISVILSNLSAGSHTITFKARKFNNVFPNAWVSAPASGSPGLGNPPNQGLLSIIILK